LSHARLGAPGAATADVVFIDRVGVLGELYALADLAFVGGGFHRAGLHSVLEPAAFGVAVTFGPLHANSREAALLVGAGGARAVADGDELRAVLGGWLEDDQARRRAGDAARAFVERNLGATARSVDLVEQLLGSPQISR
jgi:3-deoxy-D-manno-octulosonic-acid transferase